MKANFPLATTAFGDTVGIMKTDEEREFEDMLVKAKAKGSFMCFTDFINNPIDKMAREELYDKWLTNCGDNLTDFHQIPPHDVKKAIIIGGSPEDIPQLPRGYTIFCVDRTAQRLDFDPDYVVSVDASPLIIPYYKNKRCRNRSLLPLCIDRGVLDYTRVNYWYMPSIDKITDHIIHKLTGLPIIQSYGNVTGAACSLAEYMGAKEIVLVGVTFGWPEGTPYEKMDWYNKFKDTGASEGLIMKAHKKITHPVWKTTYISDPLFDLYRSGFYKWLESTTVKVINATGGGTLYHDKLECASLNNLTR